MHPDCQLQENDLRNVYGQFCVISRRSRYELERIAIAPVIRAGNATILLALKVQTSLPI